MGTLLRYDITTNPFPLQASAGLGDPLTAQVTIVAWNPTPANPVTLQHLSITFPVGDSKTDLTLDSTDIVAIPPSGWTLQGTEPSETSVSYIFAPESGSAQFGPSVNFVFNSIKINRMSGTAQVEVMEGSNNCRPAHCPTSTLAITKFPNGWGQVTFQTDPWPAIVPYDSGVTLFWSGPVGATYSLEYYTPQTGPVNLPALSNEGQYPATTAPPLQLTSDTVFYLNVVENIANQIYTAQQQINVTIEVPLPVITLFTAELVTPEDPSNPVYLALKWNAQNADTCTITGDPHPVNNSSMDWSYRFNPSVDKPLLMKYTLTATNAAGAVSSQIVLQWGVLTTAMANWSGWFTGVACSPDGSRVYFSYDNYDGTPVTLNAFDSRTLQSVQTPQPLGFQATMVVSPDGSSIFMADSDSTVYKFSATTLLQQVASAPLGNPQGITVSPDGSHLFVTSFEGSTISVLDAATLTVLSAAPAGQYRNAAFSPDGSRLYLAAESNVQAFEPAAGANLPLTFISQSPGLAYPADLGVTFDNAYILVVLQEGNLTLLDVTTLQPVGQGIPIPQGVTGIAISPDNTRAFLGGDGSGLMVIVPSVVTGGTTG